MSSSTWPIHPVETRKSGDLPEIIGRCGYRERMPSYGSSYPDQNRLQELLVRQGLDPSLSFPVPSAGLLPSNGTWIVTPVLLERRTSQSLPSHADACPRV